MIILSLDSTQEEISCAVYLGSQRLSCGQWTLTKTEQIPQYLAQMLNNQSLKPTDIKRLAVVTGPGNYSSLRNGLIAIKTMGQCLDIPMVACTKIEAMCYRYRHYDGWLAPILDVRQNMLYVAVARYQQSDQKVAYRVKADFIQRSTLQSHLLNTQAMVLSAVPLPEWPGAQWADIPYGYACEAAEMAVAPTATVITFEQLRPLYARPAVHPL